MSRPDALSARAVVEDLLRARRLERTLTSERVAPACARDIIPSGIPALDAHIGGGWPLAQWSEIVGPRSSGRTWTMAQGLAAATRRGELIAVIDAFDTWDPASLIGLDPDWSRWLWVRGPSMTMTAPASAAGERTLAAQAIDRALKATAMLLQAGGFAIVVLDLSEAPPAVLRALPFTTWRRFERMIEGQATAGVLMGSHPTMRSAEGVSLHLASREASWHGSGPHGRYLAGSTVRGRVIHARHPQWADAPVSLSSDLRRAG